MYAKGKVFNEGRDAGVMTGEGREVKGRINSYMGGYTNYGYSALAEISNSPSRRKGNLNHQKKRGLASFNQKTRGKNMNQIATQASITEVKRLRTAKTQIFNNRSDAKMKSLYTYEALANTMMRMKINGKEVMKCLK